MANKYMKQYSTSLAIKEMLVKTTVRFHLTLIRSSRKQMINAGEDTGKKEPLFTVGENIN
jgi:hypothetical protein